MRRPPPANRSNAQPVKQAKQVFAGHDLSRTVVFIGRLRNVGTSHGRPKGHAGNLT